MNTYLIKKKEDFAHVFRNGSFLNCNSFTIKYDYILVVKKNLLNENFKILSSQLEQTLNKIKTL